MTKSDITNPLPGDEQLPICVMRQIDRGVPVANAHEVCRLLSTILPANGIDKEADMVIIPVTFTREGVHNGRYKPWDSIKNAADTLLGTPFFINQAGEHENGVWPPTNDKTRWHGLVVQVNVNEDKKQLDGLLGLFKPEVMTANGASADRVDFQKNFLKAVDLGGKFAVSVAFGARVAHVNGHFGDKAYQAIEEKLVFNSVSLVPRGAEQVAIMNGGEGMLLANKDLNAKERNALENDSFAYIDSKGGRHLPIHDASHVRNALARFNQTHFESESAKAGALRKIHAAAKKFGVEVSGNAGMAPSADEGLYTPRGQHGSTTMADGQTPAEWAKTASLDALANAAPEVNKLREQYEGAKAQNGEYAAAFTALANAFGVDISKMSPIDAATAFSGKFGEVRSAREAADKDLKVFRDAETVGLQTRITKAEKALANVYKPEDLAAFKDAKDLSATANRLEKLAAIANGSGPITPPEGGEGDEAGANGEDGDAENKAFDGLVNIFKPKEA